jgi:regulator of extracellular matrix RemA (YlzA/DUF370 family)
LATQGLEPQRQTRAVLILDSWNPDLSAVERAAVTDLVAAIGDFNRLGEIPTRKSTLGE